MTSKRTGLTKAQTVVINGVLPILVLGLGVPVGTVAVLLLLKSAPLGDAFDHGELLLGAGNAALVGVFAFLSDRPNDSLNVTLAAIVYTVLVGMASYVGWAYVSVEGLTNAPYSHSAALYLGGGFTLLSVGVSLYLVSKTFRPPGAASTR